MDDSKRLELERLLMVKAAWYYYIENFTQQAIADLLGVSRAKVILLLEKARQTGVIQFSLHSGSSHRMGLEQRLIDSYRLKDAFVIPGAHTLPDLRESVAQGAAMYILRRLEPGGYINIGYGDTAGRILNHVAAEVETPINVVSLTGGVNCYLPNTRSSVFNARLFLAPSPLLLSSPATLKAMSAEPDVKDVAGMIPLAAMTVLSVGYVGDSATIVRNGVLSKQDITLLKMQGAVGDILGHFIDSQGRPTSQDMEDRLMSIPLETLRELRNVICAAAGPEKVEPTRAALRGGYVDILITDEDTAEQILRDPVA